MERSILGRLVKLYFLNSFGWCCLFYIAIGPIKILVSFTYIEVKQLILHLDLPKDFVSLQTRVKEDAFTALCMLLCRLEYPAQLCDVEMQLSWEATHFSQITQLIVPLHVCKGVPPRLCHQSDGWYAGGNQQLMYNGWKQMHCLKYHVIISPDGMIIHIFGPIEGCQHNETCFKKSGVLEILEKHFWSPMGEPLIVYGDPTYTVLTTSVHCTKVPH
jgi:hypothetical protein